MLGVLGVFVMDGSITVGSLVSAYMYVNYIFAPMTSLMGMQEQLAQKQQEQQQKSQQQRQQEQRPKVNKKIKQR